MNSCKNYESYLEYLFCYFPLASEQMYYYALLKLVERKCGVYAGICKFYSDWNHLQLVLVHDILHIFFRVILQSL